MEYRSPIRLLGLPLVHFATGRLEVGQYRRGIARGWIAVGDIAFGGLLAVGGIPVGTIGVGGLALGGLALGGLSIGIAAVGGVAVGLAAVGPHANDLAAREFLQQRSLKSPRRSRAEWAGWGCCSFFRSSWDCAEGRKMPSFVTISRN
jgi:hypothetical protein